MSTKGHKNYVPSEIKYTKLTLHYIKMQSTSMACIRNVI